MELRVLAVYCQLFGDLNSKHDNIFCNNYWFRVCSTILIDMKNK